MKAKLLISSAVLAGQLTCISVLPSYAASLRFNETYQGAVGRVSNFIYESQLTNPNSRFNLPFLKWTGYSFFPEPGKVAYGSKPAEFGFPANLPDRISTFSDGKGNSLFTLHRGLGTVDTTINKSFGTAQWEIIGGEGRFKNARGSLNFQYDENVNFLTPTEVVLSNIKVTFDGNIELDKASQKVPESGMILGLAFAGYYLSKKRHRISNSRFSALNKT